jgi:hypothetical protein
VVILLVVAFLIFSTGATLVIDAWIEWRYRPSLVDRLAPYMPTAADVGQAI